MRKLIFFLFLTLALFLLLPILSSDIEMAYATRLHKAEEERATLRKAYKSASSPKEKRESLLKAKKHLNDLITRDLFPFWYGTRWDYNGTTRTPRKGKIACGYFVANILLDAGYEFNRRQLATKASEKIILTFAEENSVKRFRNKSVKQFVKEVEKMGDGLYLLGLDTHIGFLVVKGNDIGFIHASRTYRSGVRWEDAIDAKAVKKSKYRVVGKLLHEDMVHLWLAEEKVVVKG